MEILIPGMGPGEICTCPGCNLFCAVLFRPTISRETWEITCKSSDVCDYRKVWTDPVQMAREVNQARILKKEKAL